jgi:hypothetical protein
MNWLEKISSSRPENLPGGWSPGVENAAMLSEIMESVVFLTGAGEAPNPQRLPHTFVTAADFERFGLSSFAFESPYDALATKTPLHGQAFRAEFCKLALACAFARLQLLRQYTLVETPHFWPYLPSRELVVGLVYLHNLLVLCREQPAGLTAMAEKSILNFFDPFHEFCEALAAKDFVWNLGDIIALHAAVLNFLSIYAGASLVEVKLERDVHRRPLQIYNVMRQKHPLILMLLEQLLEFSPLSRFWFLAAGPFHFEENGAKWFAQSRALFCREALPVLSSLADYLVSAIFRPRSKDGAEPGGYRVDVNALALRSLAAFFQAGETAAKKNNYVVYFRILFCYYMYESHVLEGLADFIASRPAARPSGPLEENSPPAILKNFLASCALANKTSGCAARTDHPDSWQDFVRSALQRLQDGQFDEKCSRLVSRLTQTLI